MRDSLRHLELAPACRRKPRCKRQSDFLCGEITIAAACSRRSTRFIAEVRKLAAEPDAEDSRTLASPDVRAGNDTPAMTPMIITTISISISVTPRLAS